MQRISVHGKKNPHCGNFHKNMLKSHAEMETDNQTWRPYYLTPTWLTGEK